MARGGGGVTGAMDLSGSFKALSLGTETPSVRVFFVPRKIWESPQ